MQTAINPCTWNAYAKFKQRDFSLPAFLEDAAAAGYDGVELGGGRQVLGTPAQCRKLVEGMGLRIAAYATSVTYNPWPPSARKVKADIRYAAALGAGVLMVCGGFIPSPRRNTYAFDYDMFAGNLGPFLRLALEQGLQPAFHPHRGCVVETLRETRQLLRRLPELRLCADIAHLEASGDDALKFIRACKRRIVYTHIKDYSWKLDSFVELGRGDGRLDVAACVRALARGGYRGWLTVELDKDFARARTKAQRRTPLQSARLCRRFLARACGI